MSSTKGKGWLADGGLRGQPSIAAPTPTAGASEAGQLNSWARKESLQAAGCGGQGWLGKQHGVEGTQVIVLLAVVNHVHGVFH